MQDSDQSRTLETHPGTSSVAAKVSLVYCFFLEDFDLQKARNEADENRSFRRKFTEVRVCTTEVEPSPITSFLVVNAPYLLLKREESHLSLPAVHGATATTVVKIRENGAGTVRYDVSFEAAFHTVLDNLAILQKAEFQIGGHTLSEHYCGIIKEDLRDLGGKPWDFKALDCLCQGHTHQKPVFLSNPYHQRPFPLTLITLDGAALDAAMQFNFQCDESQALDQSESGFFRALLALLVGLGDLKSKKVDLRFCKQYGLIGEDGRLNSLSARTDFFRNISHRACLCLCSTNNVHCVTLHSSTVEVAETARVRWYLNGISNFWLDFRIQHARELLQAIKSLDPMKRERAVFQQLDDILHERVSEGSTRLRFFEDSIVYLVGSGALNAMYSRAMELWRFRDAERLLFEKERALNGLVDQIVDYARLKQLRAALEGKK